MADSFMPLWLRTEAVPAMRIDKIEAPTVREPFMWNLVGNIGRGNAVHIERVHADWIGRYLPEVGGYVVSEMDGSLSYWRASMFEGSHKSMEPRQPVPDINPLAGKVWNVTAIYDTHTEGFSVPMEGVNIDKAHGQAKPEAGR